MISIIGSGKVGSTIAFLIASNSLDDVTLINRTKNKAIGESLDISNVIPSTSPFTITGTDDYRSLKESNIVVITASTGVYTKSRTDTLNDQVKMIINLATQVSKYAPSAKILIISNPVDVLTYFFVKEGRFDPKQVIGIASSLDTSRLRLLISKQLNSRQDQIKNAMVLGEHGDSMVPIYSKILYRGKKITALLDNKNRNKITHELRQYWLTLRKYKSRSVFGISKNAYDVIYSIINNKKISIPASVLLNGEYGLTNVCLGVPIEINRNGVFKINQIKLDPNEKEDLHKSAKIIRNYIESI